MAQIVKSHVTGGDFRRGSVLPDVLDAEPQHIGRGDGLHRGHMHVPRVEYGGATGHQATHDFAFRLRNALWRTEFAKMRHADLENNGDVRRCDRGQVCNLPHMVRAHLSD